ncbi:MAG TPA: hypothetical protein VHN14_19390 [Kofleriaceae bacterium]|jgi:hypothetical protein|nr:hypothetical protein [Kofleriaceae bacterium]
MLLAGWLGLAVMDTATPAFADPARLVTEPAGWHADPEQATALAQRLAATGHLGTLPAATAAEAYVADRPGVALFVTRATRAVPDPPAQIARITRAALDELRASSQRASLAGGTTEERAWQERVETAAKQVTAMLSWNDTASHTTETARIVVASDGKRIVAVTGECLAGDAADPALVAACQASLATLNPGVAAAQRIALTLAPPATASAPVEVASPTGEGSAPAPAPVREPARLDDGSHIVLPPMTIPLDKPDVDRRPMLVGAGVIVLALMFWWNRRRRDLFEQEDRGVPRRPRPRDPDNDDDADDLHAAARGDPPDPQGTPDRQDP